MGRTKLEGLTEKLISLKLITSTTGTLSDRAKRKYEKTGEEAYKILKTKKRLPEDSSFLINLTWDDQAVNWARNLTLAIEEFKQKYPEYGEKLSEIISKHRRTRRAYLEFGLVKEDLSEEEYIEVIKGLVKGLDDEKAWNVYNSVRILEGAFNKRKRKIQRLLLPE